MTAAEIEAAAEAAGLAALPPGGGRATCGLSAIAAEVEFQAESDGGAGACGDCTSGIWWSASSVRRRCRECRTLLDFGSGAGLPGIPIAIVRPEIRVTLGESQGKKAAFLREVVRILGLNAEVFDQRIEKMAANRVFDVVTLRAVDKMAEACRAGADRVRAGAGWLCLRRRGSEESLKPMGAGIDWARRLGIAGLDDGLLLLGQKR